jgi:hypothetical protein
MSSLYIKYKNSPKSFKGNKTLYCMFCDKQIIKKQRHGGKVFCNHICHVRYKMGLKKEDCEID